MTAAVRLQPDDWPPYAEQAWTTKKLVNKTPRLRAVTWTAIAKCWPLKAQPRMGRRRWRFFTFFSMNFAGNRIRCSILLHRSWPLCAERIWGFCVRPCKRFAQLPPTQRFCGGESRSTHHCVREQPRVYEPGGGGAEDVIGEITSSWAISPWTDKSLKRGTLVPIFRLTGNASIRVRILRENAVNAEVTELAMWRMELGAEESPGCFFHIQVLGHKETPPFPASLSVPRLPALAFTPMAALEFLLGELFQAAWRGALRSRNWADESLEVNSTGPPTKPTGMENGEGQEVHRVSMGSPKECKARKLGHVHSSRTMT